MSGVTRVCVLRKGGDYRPEHVQWLARQVPGLICMSDTPVSGVRCVPLMSSWPGWWAKMELFGPAFAGDLLYFDLDTVVMCDPSLLEHAASGKTTMLSDFLFPAHPASGLMYIAQADKDRVWREWTRSPYVHMSAPESPGKRGDQGFIGRVLPGVQRWQSVTAGIYGYNSWVRKHGVPGDAKVICFFGKPRPWDAGCSWVPCMSGSSKDLVC